MFVSSGIGIIVEHTYAAFAYVYFCGYISFTQCSKV